MSSGGAASPAEFVAIPKHGQVAPQSVTQKLTRVAFDLRWRLAIGGAILGLLLLGRWIFLAVRPASLVAPFTAAEAQAAQQVWAVALGKASPIERNSIGMELVLIPPGKFLMGDVSPVEVTLTQPYYLGKTEVTQGEWQTVMNTMPWQTHPDTNDDANSPARGSAKKNA